MLISARRLVMLYISTKFCEIISNGIKVIERTRFLYRKFQSYGPDTNVQPLTDGRTDGRTDTQKFGGYNILPRHFLWRGIKMGIRSNKVLIMSRMELRRGPNFQGLSRIQFLLYFFAYKTRFSLLKGWI